MVVNFISYIMNLLVMFYCGRYSREIIIMFPDLTLKNLTLAFSQTLLEQDLSILCNCNCNHNWSLLILTMFDDIDLVSRLDGSGM